MKKVLVIDDDPIQLEIVKNLLTESGFEVIEASSGESVENIIVRHKPGLVLTDIIMPNRDGFEAILSIRKKLREFVPIIAMSSNEDYLDFARKLGADAALTKPFDADALVQLVNRLI